MSRISALVCALACTVATLVVAPAAHAEGASPVRILIVGDSLTLGRHGMYTWRYRLDKELRRQGVPFNFVGSLSSPFVDPGFPAPRYTDPDFDQDHFCKSGWRLRDAIGGPLAEEVRAQDPDVVVLELGSADFFYGEAPDFVATQLRSAITEMQAVKPTLRIILPDVLTREARDPTINPRAESYDAELPDLASELSTDTSPVTVVDTMSGWSPSQSAGLTMDGSHLSPTGETFYAQRIAEELHAIGILPQTPDIFHGYIPYTRTVPLTLKAATGHLQASWSQQTVSAARIRWRPVGATAWHTSALYPKGTVGWAVPSGRAYDVQLQITWYRLTGAWGSTTRVAVPRAPRPTPPARVRIGPARVRWTASARATSYVVKFHKAHRPWVTRRTRATSIRAAHAAVAEVRAVNAGGMSAWRSAHRAT